MRILGPDGSIIAKGRVDGETKDGRPKVVFDTPTDKIPAGSHLVIDFNGGGRRNVELSNPNEKFTY